MAETCQTLPSLSSWAHRRMPEAEFITFPPATTSVERIQTFSNDNAEEGQLLRDVESSEYIAFTQEEQEISGYKPTESAAEYVYNFSQALEYSSGENVESHNSLFLPELSGMDIPLSYQLDDQNIHPASEEILFENVEDERLEDQETSKKLTGQQRVAANKRERRRMNTINQAFEALRMHLPVLECERKLSKADTLRVAAEYIKFMDHILKTTAPMQSEYGRRGDMLLIKRKIGVGLQRLADDNDQNEDSISVLLTWSRKRELNNSFVENGKRKIRAPIWNPEFPVTNLGKKRKPSFCDSTNTESLVQQFHNSNYTGPMNKILRLKEAAQEPIQYDDGSNRQYHEKHSFAQDNCYPPVTGGEVDSGVSIPHLNVFHSAITPILCDDVSSYEIADSSPDANTNDPSWKTSSCDQVDESFTSRYYMLESRNKPGSDLHRSLDDAEVMRNRHTLFCDGTHCTNYSCSNFVNPLIYYPCNLQER